MLHGVSEHGQERGIEIAHTADIFFCMFEHHQEGKPGDFEAYTVSFQWSAQAPLTNLGMANTTGLYCWKWKISD